MKHYLLIYENVPDHAERRGPFRGEHLGLAREAQERGDLVLAGAFADEPAGAVLLFQGESPEVAESFAENDPYVRNGLVTTWRVREWITVVGDAATTPLR